MVAVIDQRVVKCRFIGEFLYYRVSFLTIFFSRSRNVHACLKTGPVGRLKPLTYIMASSCIGFDAK